MVEENETGLGLRCMYIFWHMHNMICTSVNIHHSARLLSCHVVPGGAVTYVYRVKCTLRDKDFFASNIFCIREKPPGMDEMMMNVSFH